jgi:hypothetical protein
LKLKINKYNSASIEVALIAALKTAVALHSLAAYLLLADNDLTPLLRQVLDGLCGNGIASVWAQACLYSLKACEIFALLA